MKRRNFYFIYTAAMVLVLMCAYWGSRAVTVISERLPIARQHCIVLDPGHGGEDGGATSCTGVLESAYNLEISRRLNDLLHFLGYETRMIRTEDVSVYTTGDTIARKKISDLKERVRMVNETENALLVSIHQNQFSDSRYSGAQVFYANTDGSRELAQQLQAELVAALNPGSSRKCKQSSGVYLMDNIRCTGVLVECGFLSNPQEEARLRSSDYQRKLCCVLASTLSRYLSDT
ncbi:MAG: N-acetylmuramoyl-L-alanine amidase [Candidatus Faecousia sp.]|nr:N-acetylmuramoyl-L-alanine amidase [Candidatus Faecousia sp.]